MAHEEILPLLDGLDEVGLGRRAGCVRAINAFHATHRLLPLAVTSRATEYTALRVRLGVAVTLQLQPLSQSQVEDYLQRLGTPALIADPALRELLPTPLLLSLAVRTYRSHPEQVAVGQGSVPERRQRLVGTFVRQALRVPPKVPDARERGPLRHMAYLARALALQPGSTFHVEFISRSWLPPAGRFAVGAATALPAALLAAFAGFTAAGLVVSTGRALLVAALLVVGCAIPMFLVDGDVPAPATGHPLRLPAAMTGIWALTSLVGGMLGGVAGGVAGGLAGAVHMSLTNRADLTPVAGVFQLVRSSNDHQVDRFSSARAASSST